MPYETAMSRATPGCFLFLVDQSSSMLERIQRRPDMPRKSEFITDALNKTITNLIIKATKNEPEPRRYYQIGVIGYGREVGSILGDALGWKDLVWVDELYANPLRIDQRIKKEPDGAGGVVEIPVRFPVWFDPVANGQTPMCAALALARNIVAQWVMEFPDSYPPVILNFTDGEANDGDPRVIAQEIQSIGTKDGKSVIFTLHVSSNEYGGEIAYPSNQNDLPDMASRLMFEMTSLLPDTPAIRSAFETATGRAYTPDSRAFVYQARIDDIPGFLDIGTSTAIDDRMRIDP